MSIFKELIGWTPDNKMNPTHEEIPEEELWEDGELTEKEVKEKIIYHILRVGDWSLVRETDNG